MSSTSLPYSGRRTATTAANAISRALRGAMVGAALLLPMAGSLAGATATAQAAAGPPAICPPGTEAQTVWVEGFEAGPNGWAATRLSSSEPLGGGVGVGQLAGSHWHLPAPAAGGVPWRGSGHAWADTFPAGQLGSQVADSVLAMTTPLSLPADTRLTFVHRFNFEAELGETGATFQVGAGIIEYSLDDGITWNDVSRPGFSLFGAGGSGEYNGRVAQDLSPDQANPLAGRAAFVGRSSADGQYRSSHLNLAALGGKQMRLRFRLATAGQAQAQPPKQAALRGWAIDDLHFYRCRVSSADPGGSVSQPPRPVGPASESQRLAAVAVTVSPMRRPRLLRPGIRDRLQVRLTNLSTRPSIPLRVCFRAPRRLIVGSRCVTVKRLPGSSAAKIDFPVKLTQALAKRKWVRIAFTARVAGRTVSKVARRYRVATSTKLP